MLWRGRRICLRAVWPVYSGPAAYIDGSDHIRRASEPARCADKRRLRFTVLFGTMPAFGTSARSIVRIDEVNRHTTHLGFVADKRPELREGPRMECCALRPSSLHPRANVREFFQRNRSLRAFGLRNNPFGKTVVDVFGKTALLTGQLPKSAAATKCAQFLQLHPQAPMPIAHILDRLA